MLAPYPRAEPAKIDPTAVEQMGLLKELTNASRTLRSEIDLPPGQRVPLLAAGERSQLLPLFPYMQTIARLSRASVVDALPDTDAPTALVRDFRLMLEIKVDVDAEIARLRKERAGVEAEAQKSRAKLSNASFVERAPPAVVQQERGRLASFDATLEKLSAQLAKLEAK
jgi:valyl-tRNA synthetase